MTESTEWIQHNGGPCPLKDGTPVMIRFRSGKEISTFAKTREDNETWTWPYGEQLRDIVAYRVQPVVCPIGMDDNSDLCSAGSCTVCMARRLEWKVKLQKLPALPTGQHYELLNDEVVIGFDPVPTSEVPPFTPEQLTRRALDFLRDTAKKARHSYRGQYWEYTTNGVMSNDLEEAAQILEDASSDAAFYMRLIAMANEVGWSVDAMEVQNFTHQVADVLKIPRVNLEPKED